MPFDILERPICYATLEVRENLLRCTRCRCAWYSSKDHQREHWPIHKKVCKQPNYAFIEKLTAQECYNKICELHDNGFDYNTAAMFERLHDYMRIVSLDDLKTDFNMSEFFELDDIAVRLHAVGRAHHPSSHSSYALEEYYEQLWACPGMPQFLYYTDIRSQSFRKMMDTFPKGCPLFKNEKECKRFKKAYNTTKDTTGESLAWFVVALLVRSSAAGELTHDSAADGSGRLRNTPYAVAARHRVAQILSTPELRNCAMDALAPVPSLILNVAENLRHEFIKFLNMGILDGIIQIALAGEHHSSYAIKTLKFISNLDAPDINQVTDQTKLDILELCCNPLKRRRSLDEGFSFQSLSDSERETAEKKILHSCKKIAINVLFNTNDITSLLEDGMCRRSEFITPDWDVDSAFGTKRMVFAYLYDIVVQHGGDISLTSLKDSFEQWDQTTITDKIECAKQVLDPTVFKVWFKTIETGKKKGKK